VYLANHSVYTRSINNCILRHIVEYVLKRNEPFDDIILSTKFTLFTSTTGWSVSKFKNIPNINSCVRQREKL